MHIFTRLLNRADLVIEAILQWDRETLQTISEHPHLRYRTRSPSLLPPNYPLTTPIAKATITPMTGSVAQLVRALA